MFRRCVTTMRAMDGETALSTWARILNKRVTRLALVVTKNGWSRCSDFADCSFANFTVNGKDAEHDITRCR